MIICLLNAALSDVFMQNYQINFFGNLSVRSNIYNKSSSDWAYSAKSWCVIRLIKDYWEKPLGNKDLQQFN